MTSADRTLLAAVRREASGADPPEERARRIVDLIRLHTGRRWVGVYCVGAGRGLYTGPSSAKPRPLRTRLADSAHTCRPWRIHALTRDFRLEDVWALPTSGGSSDFHRLVQVMVSFNPSRASAVVPTLFAIRWKVGALLGWDAADDGQAERPTLRSRLPADLRDRPSGPDARPFASLYLTDDEWAAEIVNRTVHGVLHLGWVDDGTGGYRGQMAVLVKPHGLLGTGYMAAITPFRRLLVYPRMLRELEREWQAGADEAAPRSKPL